MSKRSFLLRKNSPVHVGTELLSHFILFRSTDVMTVMRAVKMDFLHRCIRPFERFVQRFSRRGHAEHAAAVRQQLTVFKLRAGMVHRHAFRLTVFRQGR